MSRLFGDGSDMLHATRHPVNDIWLTSGTQNAVGHYGPDWRDKRRLEQRKRRRAREPEHEELTWDELNQFADWIHEMRKGAHRARR